MISGKSLDFVIKAIAQGLACALQAFAEGGGVNGKRCGEGFTRLALIIETADRLMHGFRQEAQAVVE